jgi:hypothetical protein
MNPQDEIPIGPDTSSTAKWVWKNLVPKSGQAETVQGELLRIVEKLRWEAQGNGNINWDPAFESLLAYFEQTLLPGLATTDDVKQEIRLDVATLRDYEHPYVNDDLYDRLTEHVIEFCRQHRQLIPKPKDPHQYR